MRNREVPIHRLRANHTVWTPPTVIVLDTETKWHDDGASEVHGLRLWVGCRVDRRSVKRTVAPIDWGWGDDNGTLGQWISDQARGRETLWLYAHNLGFDLATTDFPNLMARGGWAVTDFSLRSGAPWMRLKRKRTVLTCCDSWTWLPESLESVAARMGGHKVALPDNADGMDDWWKRCASDVDLTMRAILSLMDWWDAEKLGRWSISGASCGWNAMRHIPTTDIVIDVTDKELIAQDRKAVRGGRKDAQICQSNRGGPWVELDFAAAYPTVARDLPLPVKRGWVFDSLDVASPWLDSQHYGIVAECTIDTDRPRYPVRHNGVTWYPVGRFRTTLAGPEIAEAAARGHLDAIGHGQAHRLGRALRPWASWVLDPTADGTKVVPPVAALATRSWGRSVLGKWAAHGQFSEQLGGVAPAGWSITDLWDARVKRRGADVTMGGRRWLVTYDGDTENCYPAVLAWVESYVRVRLNRALDALGAAWWACDTDGLILDLQAVPTDLWRPLAIEAGRPTDLLGVAEGICRVLNPQLAPLTLRPKRVVRSLAVLGPQHLTVDGEHRYAGLSKSATQEADGTFKVRDWPSLTWQMKNGRPGAYIRPERKVRFRRPTVHRWLLNDGTAVPVCFALDDAGNNQVIPWFTDPRSRSTTVLAPVQYRGLEPLRLEVPARLSNGPDSPRRGR